MISDDLTRIFESAPGEPYPSALTDWYVSKVGACRSKSELRTLLYQIDYIWGTLPGRAKGGFRTFLRLRLADEALEAIDGLMGWGLTPPRAKASAKRARMSYQMFCALPFKVASHVNNDEGCVTTYRCADPRYPDVWIIDGYAAGARKKEYRHWRVNGEVCKTKEQLMKAIERL